MLWVWIVIGKLEQSRKMSGNEKLEKDWNNKFGNYSSKVVPGLANKTLGITNVGCILMFESSTKCRIIAMT